MRFLLNPIGSLGDINPFLGIGRELVRRGHAVVVLANPFFERAVREAELAFEPVGTAADLEEFWRHPLMWNVNRFWKTSLIYSALHPMQPAYEAILKNYQPGETALVAPAWSFGSRIARETHGIPLATVHLEPYLIRSAVRSARMPAPLWLADWMPQHWKQIQFWIADRFFIDRCIGPETNAFRRRFGLSPAKRFMQSWWHSPDLVIGMFPEWFCSPQSDWPQATQLVGFPTYDGSKEHSLPAEVEAFLSAGSPPIAFTPGTANQRAAHFFQAAADACRRLGRRGILLTRYPEQLPADLSDDVRAFQYVPFRALLPRCSAVVHHGGTGTTALACAAGIPHVVTPMSFSQPDFARRLEHLRVGRELTPRRLTGRSLAAALSELFSSAETATQCRELALRMRSVDSESVACDRLERLLPAGRVDVLQRSAFQPA